MIYFKNSNNEFREINVSYRDWIRVLIRFRIDGDCLLKNVGTK